MPTSANTSGHDRQPSVQLKIESCGGPPNQQTRRLSTILLRNGKYFLSQISIVVSKLSPTVQSICIVLLLLYLIQLSGDSIRDLLVLIPGSLLSPGQWYRSLLSSVTHPFVEFHFYSLIVDIISLSLCATLIEPLWGQSEVLLFFTIISISSAFLTCFHYIILYTITTDSRLIFSRQIHGLSPFCASIAVTVKQLLPESVLLTTTIGKLKNDHIPITSLLLAIIAYFLNLIEDTIVVMFFYGLIVSWIYLRFFQLHKHNMSSNKTRSRGDLSDAFAFYTFFPNVLRPIVAIFADAFYRLFVKIGLCPDISSGQHYQTYRLLSERLTNDINHSNHSPKVETL